VAWNVDSGDVVSDARNGRAVDDDLASMGVDLMAFSRWE
jgi:hypothetical protein